MFYIFHGPDDFSAREMLSRLIQRLGDPDMVALNTTELAGKALTVGELIHHAHAMPFLAPKRVVIVQDYLAQFDKAPKNKADKQTLAALLDALDGLPDTTNLVFMEQVELKKRNPVLQKALLIDKAVQLFSVPGNLPGWIERRTKQKHARIDRQAAEMLSETVGPDLRALDNEIEKLSLYTNGERAITLADVELLSPYTAASGAFELANAIGRQDARTALTELHKRLNEGQHPLAIMAGITTQFRGLLEVKSLAEDGLSPKQIAEYKKWKNDYAVRKRLQEARHFSTERLIEIFNLLRDTDVAIKTGQIEDKLALDTVVTRLCGVRNGAAPARQNGQRHQGRFA